MTLTKGIAIFFGIVIALIVAPYAFQILMATVYFFFMLFGMVFGMIKLIYLAFFG